MYKPFLCFLDPVVISCLNEEYFEMINTFCNRINEIEQKIFQAGDARDFFKIPLNQGIEDAMLTALYYNNQYLKYNPHIGRAFSNQYYRILQRLFLKWDLDEVSGSTIYSNSQIDDVLREAFNDFLCACANMVEFTSGHMTFPHSDIFPTYISNQTTISHSRFQTSSDSNEIFSLIPYNNFFSEQIPFIGSELAIKLVRFIIELAQGQNAVGNVDELDSILARYKEFYSINDDEFDKLVKNLRPSDAGRIPNIKLKEKEPKYDKPKRKFIDHLLKRFPYITLIRDGAWNSETEPYILRIPPNQIEISCPFAKDYSFPFYITTTAQSDLELLLAEKEIGNYLIKRF